MKSLENKIAIVTGANQGIGLAITKQFVAQGAIVYAFDIREDADYGEGVTFIKNDVTQESDWKTGVERVIGEQGRIDILVNNAGVIAYTPIHEIELDEWHRLIAVDQTGVLLGMKHTIPQMIKQNYGAIINVSSIWGSVGAANVVAYNAAKGAVVLMTKNAAITYAKNGIRVNSVHPGFIHTPLTDSQNAVLNDVVIAATPMGRGGEPDEIASGVVFLASDQASYVTGSELVIDGGYTAQ
ncbi:3alpha(or 20beta)-hydroxysteroid dehydrogenase [Dyadobacter sp. SG02]|uniref:SDR family NAD(P)-dependent oxidoreductase n=1 Tax=Dyadobacter sp. SG02 TaxID=1855291 RepID=UPI0008C7383D|nr:glucose 1-dehydrogenase [Dyadobacter sp. SG02]SEI53554.1 3alpha(or 20beta)-hydroxysteroid dehydrogenase [Dyadobacter sp. SG02]